MTDSNPNLIACRGCSKMMSRRAENCPFCGEKRPEVITCAVCMETIIKNLTVCPNCGDPSPAKTLISADELDECVFEYEYRIDGEVRQLRDRTGFVRYANDNKINLLTFVCRRGFSDFSQIRELEDQRLAKILKGFAKPSKLSVCNYCTRKVSPRATVCPGCSKRITCKCVACGALIVTDSVTCPECGDPFPFNDKGLVRQHSLPELEIKDEPTELPELKLEKELDKVKDTQDIGGQLNTAKPSFSNASLARSESEAGSMRTILAWCVGAGIWFVGIIFTGVISNAYKEMNRPKGMIYGLVSSCILIGTFFLARAVFRGIKKG